jgi:hypothetical protein
MANLSPIKLPRHFWNEDSGLTGMFILLCITNFLVVPFLTQNEGILLLMRLVWLVLLFTGITTLAKSRAQMRTLSIIPVLLIVVSALEYFLDYKLLDYIGLVIEIAVFALLTGMVLIKVFEGGKVTIHRVVGSIVAYMLIANIWTILYNFLYLHVPGSLQIPEASSESRVPVSTFLYFSYTTMTTTGFGEILPVNAIARTLVIIEQLIGVLYPVILIGRLVSLVSGDSESSVEGEK